MVLYFQSCLVLWSEVQLYYGFRVFWLNGSMILWLNSSMVLSYYSSRFSIFYCSFSNMTLIKFINILETDNNKGKSKGKNK